MTPDTPRQAGAVRPKLNAEVLKLGLVSFPTDLSSEAIFSVFAVFFTTVAGASAALLRVIERVTPGCRRWPTPAAGLSIGCAQGLGQGRRRVRPSGGAWIAEWVGR